MSVFAVKKDDAAMKDKGGEPKPGARYTTASQKAAFLGQKEKILEKMKLQLKTELDRLPKPTSPSIGYFHGIADIYSTRLDELTNFKKGGGHVVGLLCVIAPAEPIYALGAIPVRICSGESECAQRAQDLIGDAGLCPLVKSIIGGTISETSPYIMLSDLIVAPTPCDAKLKVSEILSDSRPVIPMNLPRVKNDAARKVWIHEINRVIGEIERLTGRKMRLSGLREAVAKFQDAQVAWGRFSEIRKNGNVIWGRDALLIADLSSLDDIGRWTKNLDKLCDELEGKLEKKEAVAPPDAPRIMLGGSPIVWPNWKVPTLIEQLGALIVCDELCSGTRVLSNPTVVEENTYNSLVGAIADRYLYPCTCPCFTPNQERNDNFIRKIKDYRVDGIVFHVLKGCHLNAIDATRIKIMASERNIPILILDSDYGDGDVGQLKIRIEAFLEMIKARKEEELLEG